MPAMGTFSQPAVGRRGNRARSVPKLAPMGESRDPLMSAYGCFPHERVTRMDGSRPSPIGANLSSPRSFSFPFSHALAWEKVPEGRMRAGAHSATVLPHVGSAMSFTPCRQIRRALSLRRADIPAEARLWSNLRGRRLQSFKFVRQEPIGPYVVDFLCREARLIVEVDGATHSEDREIAYDPGSLSQTRGLLHRPSAQ